MSYSQADIAAIAKLIREQKLDDSLAAAAEVDSKNESGSTQPQKPVKPASVPSTNVGPTPAPQESDIKDLDAFKGNPRSTQGLESFNILEACSRTVFSKEIEHETSTFLPSAHRMYALLHEIDDILVQNRYFRQAIPSFLPTQSRVYFGILFIMQTYRCMIHAGLNIDVLTKATVEQFFAAHPVATLPVAGPLLPVLQALCVSNPQDGTMPRVCPRLPAQLGPAQAQNIIQGPHNFAIPNIPMLFGLHEYIRDYSVQHPNDTAEDILDHFGIDADSTVAVTINGRNFPAAFAGLPNARLAWTAASPGIGQPLEMNQDLYDNFKRNRRFLRFPVLGANTGIRTLNEFCQLSQGNWFSTLKRNMAIYCRYVKGSGTMQDLKVEGPAAGQIVSLVSVVGVAQPTGFFRQSRLFPGDASYSTTQPANDRVAELTSVYSQIHIRVIGHPEAWFDQIGEDDINNGRDGEFWNIRPIRPQTAPDHFKDSLGAEVSRYVRERADKD